MSQVPSRVRESYSESHNGSEECSEDRFTDININRAISSSSIDSMGEREIERDSRVSPQMIPNPYHIYPAQVRVGGPPYMNPQHFYSNPICSCCAANYIYVHPALPNPSPHHPPCQCSHNMAQPSLSVQPNVSTVPENTATKKSTPQPPKKEAKQNAAKIPPVMNLTAAAAVDPRKFKTQMCRNWEKNGQCPYRSSCCFAHGQSELRDIPSNQSLMAYIGHVSNLLLMASGDAEKTKVLQSQLQQTMAMLSPASRPPNANS